MAEPWNDNHNGKTEFKLAPIPFNQDAPSFDYTYPPAELLQPVHWRTYTEALQAVTGPDNPLHFQRESLELCRTVAVNNRSSPEELVAAIKTQCERSSRIVWFFQHVKIPLCELSANLSLHLVVAWLMTSKDAGKDVSPVEEINIRTPLLNFELILAIVMACPRLAASIGKILQQFRLVPWDKPIEMFVFSFNSGESFASDVWNYLRYVHAAMNDIIVSQILKVDPLTFSFKDASLETRCQYRFAYLLQPEELLMLTPETRVAAGLLMEAHYIRQPEILARARVQAFCFHCGVSTRADTAWRQNYKRKDRILKACSKCKFAQYCDEFCQEKHWSKHKLTCNKKKTAT